MSINSKRLALFNSTHVNRFIFIDSSGPVMAILKEYREMAGIQGGDRSLPTRVLHGHTARVFLIHPTRCGEPPRAHAHPKIAAVGADARAPPQRGSTDGGVPPNPHHMLKAIKC